jgi:hypothetical protein
MAKELWIQEAIQHEGSLTRKARRAGQTVTEFCQGKMEGSSQTAYQCRLAAKLREMRSKKAK